MTTGIRSDASGTFGALTFGGDDAVTFDATGIQAGSYKAGSIVAADFADGALIENAPVGIGYGPGAGGTVTQATSKFTAVTLNKPCGVITMHNASLPALSVALFKFTNSTIGHNDGMVLNILTGAVDPSMYRVTAENFNDGFCGIYLRNLTGSELAEAVQISFKVIKGAIA